MKKNKNNKKYFDAGSSMKDQFFTFTGEFSMTTLGQKLQLMVWLTPNHSQE